MLWTFIMILLCCFRSRRPVSVCRGDSLHCEGEEVLRADREGVWILQQATAGTTCGRERTDGQDQVITEGVWILQQTTAETTCEKERTDGQDQVMTESCMNTSASYCSNYLWTKLIHLSFVSWCFIEKFFQRYKVI